MANVVEIALKGIDKTGNLFVKAEGNLNKMKTAATGLAKAGALMGAAMGAALIEVGRRAINTADELGKLAQVVSWDVEQFSKLAFAAKLSNIPLTDLRVGLNSLNKNMVTAAKGGAEFVKAFRALGVEVTDVQGNLRSNKEVFFDVSDRLSEMEDGAEKSALALKILGESGARMLPLLNEGARGIKETGEGTFGVTQEMAEQASKFNTEMGIVFLTVSEFGLRLAAELLPHLSEFSAWLVKTQKETDFLGTAVSFVINLISTTAKVVHEAWQRFKQLQAIIGFIAESTIGLFVAGLNGLQAAFRRILQGIRDVGEAGKLLIDRDFAGAWNKAKEAAASLGTDLRAEFKDTFKQAADGAKESADTMVKEFAAAEAAIDSFNNKVDAKLNPNKSGAIPLDKKGTGGFKPFGGLPGDEDEDDKGKKPKTLKETLAGQLVTWKDYREQVQAEFELMGQAAEDFSVKSVRGLVDGVGSAVADIATGARSAGDAFKALGLEMAGSLIKFGVQMVLNSILASALRAKATGESVAQAGIVGAAWAGPAAAVNAATFGSGAVAGQIALTAISSLASSLFAGQAHSGMSVPRDGSYLLNLQKGEEIVSARRSGGEDGAAVEVNVFLDDEVLAKSVTRLARNGRVVINQRAIES